MSNPKYYERKRLKKEVASRKGSQTVEGSLSGVLNTPAHKNFSKAFTTKPKLRSLTFHTQQTVRNRVHALQESFYPTTDITYNTAKIRMATLLGIVDRKSVLAYLGRPSYVRIQKIDQTVQYLKTGTIVPKTHRFKRVLKRVKGYIEIFGVGYVYLDGDNDDDWFIHWDHETQLTLPESEGFKSRSSKENFSPPISNGKETPKTRMEIVEYENRERVLKGERNCESESNQQFSNEDHACKVKLNALEKSILRISKEGDSK